ncbi:hypothetical protein ACKTEK_00500 [Tepidamorphus sp. 3E244]|uniref:hypothetical protein n=1 Tax=Tepidamorphus sp. 3E244 TaxID=3385498 RepID=UPI0038FCAB5F
MFRLLARLLGFIIFAAALITMVHDGALSIAASELVITSLGEMWFAYSPPGLNLTQAIIERNIHPYLWDPIMLSILKSPAALVFMVIALIFAFLGRRRTKVRAGLDLR